MPQRLAVIKGTDNGDKWLYDAKQFKLLMGTLDSHVRFIYFYFSPVVFLFCAHSYKTVLFTMETFLCFHRNKVINR